ncbi:MAG: bifunctional DNA primase/polymerase [Bacteroidetes bacterium]|nr:bifunctional DNA primase/polymerase [Bacteroidota bacterium]
MGVFGSHAPNYLAHGIAVFPTGGETGKQALVKNYQKMGIPASTQLAGQERFHDANIGFLCGKRNRITVLDVDTPNITVFNRLVAECGDTAIKVQTGSNKYQAWYRHNGELRKIRPIEGEEIDILGDGVCIAPPSIRPDLDGKAYRFLEGSLDDVCRLPTIREGALPPELYGMVSKQVGTDNDKILDGNRNNAFFPWAMMEALTCETEAELLFKAAARNEAVCDPPLSESRVASTIHSVWGYKERDSIWIGKEARAVITTKELDNLDSNADAAFLLMRLRAAHGWRGGGEFALSKAFAASLGWTLPCFKRARAFLVEREFIVCLHQGGKGPHDPPIYRLV